MKTFYFSNPRIGLDLDELLVDFLGGFSDWTKIDYRQVKNFEFSYSNTKIIDSLPPEFWLNLKPLIKPEDLNFLPVAYITKRKFDEEITKNWIEKNGFPCKKVYHVREESKFNACLEAKLDYYIDDSIFNFQDLNSKGIKTFLMDSPHNRQFDVGEDRVYNIKDLIKKIETDINFKK